MIELVNEEGYPHDAAIEKVVGYEEAFECKCADKGAQYGIYGVFYGTRQITCRFH